MRAQPQDEPPTGLGSQVPGRVGQVGRAAGERDGDCRAEVHARGVLGDQRAGQERVVLGLGRPQGSEAGLLGGASGLGYLGEGDRGEGGVEEHSVLLG